MSDTSTLELRLAAAKAEIEKLQKEIDQKKNPKFVRNMAALSAAKGICVGKGPSGSSKYVNGSLMIHQNNDQWKVTYGDGSGEGEYMTAEQAAEKCDEIVAYAPAF
jgi:hypothetical protein